MGGGFSTGGGGGGSGGGGHVLSSRRLSPAMEAAGALVLAFNPATQAKLAKALAAVARAEGIDVAPARLTEIAAASEGDVRCAVGTLQLMASGRTSDPAAAAAAAGAGKKRRAKKDRTRPATAWGPSPPPRMRESVDATRVSPCSTPWGRSCTTNATPGLPWRTRERTAPRTASLPSRPTRLARTRRTRRRPNVLVRARTSPGRRRPLQVAVGMARCVSGLACRRLRRTSDSSGNRCRTTLRVSSRARTSARNRRRHFCLRISSRVCATTRWRMRRSGRRTSRPALAGPRGSIPRRGRGAGQRRRGKHRHAAHGRRRRSRGPRRDRARRRSLATPGSFRARAQPTRAPRLGRFGTPERWRTRRLRTARGPRSSRRRGGDFSVGSDANAAAAETLLMLRVIASCGRRRGEGPVPPGEVGPAGGGTRGRRRAAPRGTMRAEAGTGVCRRRRPWRTRHRWRGRGR